MPLLSALSIWVLGRNLPKCRPHPIFTFNGCLVVLDVGDVKVVGIGAEAVVVGGGGVVSMFLSVMLGQGEGLLAL